MRLQWACLDTFHLPLTSSQLLCKHAVFTCTLIQERNFHCITLVAVTQIHMQN